MDNRKLNEKESLDLIAQMIRNTQDKIEQKSGKMLLYWGYLAVAIALLVWLVINLTGNYLWGVLWFIAPLLGWPATIHFYKKHSYVITYVDKIIKNIWIVIGLAIIVTCGITFVFLDLDSLFFSAILLAVGATLTGLVTQVKSVIITGYLGILISPVTLFLDNNNQIFILVVIFILLLIIPGHILNYKSKRQA